ncbi:MAG: TlyA family rRNA (cytidine-2'-O)-methyltransferase [Dehalococcoidia bacterium]|nr:MAG: TlyA family rRNA (cytidine-2'-O)-methyltransferase [Dehalococcoidia bacterium]
MTAPAKRVVRERLDRLLVARGLAASREQAQALILAGEVLVGGQVVRSASERVAYDAPLAVAAPPPYVSRGGQKLAGALAVFPVDPAGQVCADVGASTGGFTDLLLQRGAARVYAIDVGYGQLAPVLRQHPRVVVMERTNARTLARLPEPVALVTIDVSFISLSKILPAVRGWLAPGGQVLALVKPQFEAGPRLVGKGGVVRDPAVRVATVLQVAAGAEQLGLHVRGVTPSPLAGPAGNREYFLWLSSDAAAPALAELERAVTAAVERETGSWR